MMFDVWIPILFFVGCVMSIGSREWDSVGIQYKRSFGGSRS